MNETIDELGNLVFFNQPYQNHVNIVSDVSVRQYSIVVAVDLDAGFAKEGKIPWYYSEDFKWFKNRTENAICVMGRNTYHDINNRLGDKAKDSVLPGRTCYVVSTTLTTLPNATVIPSLSELNKLLDIEDTREVCIIGGGGLFAEGIGKVNTVYLTVINKKYQCDAFFPVKYLLKHFNVHTMYKGKDPSLRYVVFIRKGYSS